MLSQTALQTQPALWKMGAAVAHTVVLASLSQLRCDAWLADSCPGQRSRAVKSSRFPGAKQDLNESVSGPQPVKWERQSMGQDVHGGLCRVVITGSF
jgi:hypothetical protein